MKQILGKGDTVILKSNVYYDGIFHTKGTFCKVIDVSKTGLVTIDLPFGRKGEYYSFTASEVPHFLELTKKDESRREDLLLLFTGKWYEDVLSFKNTKFKVESIDLVNNIFNTVSENGIHKHIPILLFDDYVLRGVFKECEEPNFLKEEKQKTNNNNHEVRKNSYVCVRKKSPKISKPEGFGGTSVQCRASRVRPKSNSSGNSKKTRNRKSKVN